MRMAEICLTGIAAFQVYDDFTGRPAEPGTVRLVLPQGVQAVSKGEGIYVILAHKAAGTAKDHEKGIAIRFLSPVYEEYSLNLFTEDYENDCPLIRIGLVPSAAMPLPAGTTTLEGTAPPGSRIFVVCESRDMAMKLLGDCRKGEQEAGIYRPYDTVLEGRLLAFQAKGAGFDLNRVRQEKENFRCCLEKPLSREYRRAGTRIFPVHEGVSGADGYYRIPLRDVPVSGCGATVILQEPGEKEIRWQMELACSVRNRRDI